MNESIANFARRARIALVLAAAGAALVAATLLVWPALYAHEYEQRALARQAFVRIAGPTACPPRLDGDRLALACGAERLDEMDDSMGFVDRVSVRDGRLRVEGWAADRKASRPALAVLLALDGEVRLWTRPRLPRDDVVQALHAPALTMTGYLFDAAVGENFRLNEHRLRVFAVNDELKARELSESFRRP